MECAAEVLRHGMDACETKVAGLLLKEHCPAACDHCEPICGTITDRQFCTDDRMDAFCGKSVLSISNVSSACPGTCGACPAPNLLDGTYFAYDLTHNSLGGGAKLRFATAHDANQRLFVLPDRPCEDTVTLSECQMTCNKYQGCAGIYLFRGSASNAIQCYGLKSVSVRISLFLPFSSLFFFFFFFFFSHALALLWSRIQWQCASLFDLEIPQLTLPPPWFACNTGVTGQMHGHNLCEPFPRIFRTTVRRRNSTWCNGKWTVAV